MKKDHLRAFDLAFGYAMGGTNLKGKREAKKGAKTSMEREKILQPLHKLFK